MSIEMYSLGIKNVSRLRKKEDEKGAGVQIGARGSAAIDHP